jgi:hypothetical protein
MNRPSDIGRISWALLTLMDWALIALIYLAWFFIGAVGFISCFSFVHRTAGGPLGIVESILAGVFGGYNALTVGHALSNSAFGHEDLVNTKKEPTKTKRSGHAGYAVGRAVLGAGVFITFVAVKYSLGGGLLGVVIASLVTGVVSITAIVPIGALVLGHDEPEVGFVYGVLAGLLGAYRVLFRIGQLGAVFGKLGAGRADQATHDWWNRSKRSTSLQVCCEGIVRPGIVLRLIARLMTPAQRRHWLAEISSALSECESEERRLIARSFVRTASEVIAESWINAASRAAREAIGGRKTP